MNAEILCVGTELLLGDIVNTNAAYLSRRLADLGIGCYYQSVVGDNAKRLSTSLSLALSRADMVVTTGGLGPTYDDLTKETIASHFGLDMVLDQPSMDRLTEMFRGRPFTKNNEKQAYFPRGCTILPNDRGTAPGLALEKDGKTVIMLPGPPSEMTAMFENAVLPYLQRRLDHVLRSHTVHLFGIGESAVEAQLHDLMLSSTNPTIAPYAKFGEVQLRVTASAGDEAAADAIADPVVKQICEMFPKQVYGVDVGSIQNALVLELEKNGKTIAVAESCTGGMIAERITDIPGSSKVFRCGVCSYSNESKIALLGVSGDTLKQYGAVSEQTAKEMAAGIRRISGADFGISTTGVAGPDGGSEDKPVGLVYIALDSADRQEVLQVNLGRRGYANERDAVRNGAALQALSLALRAASGKLYR